MTSELTNEFKRLQNLVSTQKFMIEFKTYEMSFIYF